MDDVIIFNGVECVTPNYIYRLDNGEFIEAKNIKKGVTIVNEYNEYIVIESVDYEKDKIGL